jgi:hypothetical protein
MEEEKKKETRHRLLGFEPSKKVPKSDEAQVEQSTPLRKEKELPSPVKFGKDKGGAVPSFLEGFQNLTEDDLEIMAEFEEEQ